NAVDRVVDQLIHRPACIEKHRISARIAPPPRGMLQKMPDRDLVDSLPVRCGTIMGSKNSLRPQHLLIKRQTSFFEQFQNSNARDRLGYTGYPEQVVRTGF